MQAKQELCFGPYRLDLEAGQLRHDQHDVKLTPKALAVLRALVTRAEQVVTKDELFQAVWSQTVVSDDALTTCVLELRHALHDNAKQPVYIETVHRRGYRFIGKVVSNQEEVVSRQEEGKNTEQAEGLKPKAEGPPLSSASSLEPTFSSLSQGSALNAQDLPALALPRSWLGRRLVWLGGVCWLWEYLESSGIAFFQSLAPSPQSPTPNPSHCLTSLRSSSYRFRI